MDTVNMKMMNIENILEVAINGMLENETENNEKRI